MLVGAVVMEISLALLLAEAWVQQFVATPLRQSHAKRRPSFRVSTKSRLDPHSRIPVAHETECISCGKYGTSMLEERAAYLSYHMVYLGPWTEAAGDKIGSPWSSTGKYKVHLGTL